MPLPQTGAAGYLKGWHALNVPDPRPDAWLIPQSAGAAVQLLCLRLN